jgi:hypothetical protein
MDAQAKEIKNKVICEINSFAIVYFFLEGFVCLFCYFLTDNNVFTSMIHRILFCESLFFCNTIHNASYVEE